MRHRAPAVVAAEAALGEVEIEDRALGPDGRMRRVVHLYVAWRGERLRSVIRRVRAEPFVACSSQG